MNRTARIVAVVPLVAGLGFLGAYAVEQGVAGNLVFDAGLATSLWSASRIEASQETMASLREDLVKAAAISPNDPAAHELLGIVDARRGSGPEYAAEADVHFVRALGLRPTAPHTWANLAATRYRRGDTGRAFEVALENAALLGPHEPEVQRAVASFGLAVWNETGDKTRAAIEGAIVAGMKRNPLEMLQIAERRGRLAVPCRHVAENTRQIESKWVQLCQSMEATS